MNRRTHQETVKRVRSAPISLATLQKELNEQQQQPGRVGAPESLSPRQRVVVGRRVHDPQHIPNLQEAFEGLPGFKYRAYRPAVIYASEQFLEQALGTNEYKQRLDMCLDTIKAEADPSFNESTQVAIHGIKAKFVSKVRVSFALELASDEQTITAARERNLLRRSLTTDEGEERSGKRLAISLGTLQLSYAMGHGITQDELVGDLALPSAVMLDPVDIIYL